MVTYILSTVPIAILGARYGIGQGPMLLDDVACSGNESSLLNCSYLEGDHDCDHDEYAIVQCLGKIYMTHQTKDILCSALHRFWRDFKVTKFLLVTHYIRQKFDRHASMILY